MKELIETSVMQVKSGLYLNPNSSYDQKTSDQKSPKSQTGSPGSAYVSLN